MKCRHCQHWNPEEQERCRLCGGKLHASGNDTTSEWSFHAVAGNLAAAPERAPKRRTQEFNRAPQQELFTERPAPKVIPFESLTGGRLSVQVEPPAAPPSRAAAPSMVAPKAASLRKTGDTSEHRRVNAGKKNDSQSELDLLPPAPVTPRKLKTKVEASIYCDAPVATLTHRSLAGLVDFCLMSVLYAVTVTSYCLMGGEPPSTRLGDVMFGAAFVVIALFYGLIWALGNTPTPGMRFTRLRLTNFDGFGTEPGQRIRRYFATCLSIACCGFGLLWALVDEESLTWQDHISKTFPTFHLPETTFRRARA
jgi:uncharacterized RDD family membrane protein YckC